MKLGMFVALGILGAMTVSAEEARVAKPLPDNQWKGKKVAYLGDSITDKVHVGTAKNYWQFLDEMLGTEAWVYGINGHTWDGVLGQAQKLKAEKGDSTDAILVFAGTNDYMGGLPLGEWYTETNATVTVWDAKVETRKRRVLNMDGGTFRGRINRVMAYLKSNFPRQQIILLTPIHRAYAFFGGGNIQPDETYPNSIGLHVEDYVKAIQEAGGVWAVPVIDLYSVSGLYPLDDAYVQYFHDTKTDRLHPNAEGHYRMARSIAYQLLAYPPEFK